MPGHIREFNRLKQHSSHDLVFKIWRNSNTEATLSGSVAAVQSCFCFIIVAAAIVLGIGALFLLFVLLYSQRVASQSCETLGELLHHPL